MAKATGSITVNNNPQAEAKTIVIDDGQGTIHSQVTLRTEDNSTEAGNAGSNKTANLYLKTTNNNNYAYGYLYLRGNADNGAGYAGASFADDWGIDGTNPAKLVITDTEGRKLSIRFSTSTSGTAGDAVSNSANSGARKVSSLLYEINGNTTSSYEMGEIFANIRACVDDANTSDSFNMSAVAKNNSNATQTGTNYATYQHLWLYAKVWNADQGPEHGGISVGLDRNSGSWTSNSDALAYSVYQIGTGTNFLNLALDGFGDVSYGRNHSEKAGSSAFYDANGLATAIKDMINALPIAITATVSNAVVSLENDAHGTDGNVTITTNDSTNFSVSGMSSGAASGGNAVAKRITISARQLALSGSGGLSGSSGGKSSLMLHIAGLGAASIAQTDVMAFADVGSSNVPKKITFSDFEDTVFGNVSGDASVAAGGALTIAADAIESGMLNDNVISGQSALGSAAAAQADEMLFSDGGTLKKITFSNLEDSIFGNVSGDATVAAGGALTIAATSVEGSMLNDNVISGLTDIGAALATTDEIMVSDAGTIRRMDLSRLSTMMAGAGLADTSGTLVLNIDGLGALSDVGNIHQTNDHFLISDGGTEKKITFSDLEDEIFGNVSGDIAVAAGGAATIQADAVESGMLNDNVISGQSALGSAAAAQADEMLFSDGGTLKKITFSNLEDSIFGNVSGDATVAAGGAMTMAAAQTNITSLLATDIKIGEDDQTKIDFATTNQIAFYANNNQEMTITDDGVTIAGNLTVNGTTTTIDTTHLLVEDSLIEIARGDGTAGTRASNADAGFYISGSVRSRDVSLTAAADGGRLRVSGSKDVGSGFDIDSAGDYAIAGTQVLSSDGAVKVQSGVAGAGLGHSAGVLSLDIDELSALGGTGVAQGDHFVFSDGGTEKKITASNLEDWMFGNVSGDATIAAGGALTIAADAVEGSMLNDNVISGQTELAQGSLAAADEIMISDGGTLKKFGADSLAKDMLALTTEAAVADGDYIMFLDGGSTGETKKEALADLATLFAGDGLTAASSVLAVQVSGAVKITSDKVGLTGSLAGSGLTFTGGANSIATLAVDIDDLDALGGAGLHQTQDHFMFSDNGTEKKITFSNLQDAVFADVSGDATVAAGGALTIAADAVESGMLNDNVISGQSALGSAAAAQADEMLFSDGGTLKKITFSNLEDSIFGNVSGDATVAAGGALTIAATAVEGSMLNNNVISGQTDVGGALATTDELLVSDNGTIRRTDLSRFSTMMAGAGLQDSSGTLTLSTREDRFTGSAVALSGNVGTLNQTPATTASVFVFINGMAQSQNYDYTVSGTTLALKGANTLASDDEVIVKYVVQ